MISKKLAAAEQETIILFNKESSMAEIYTYEKTWQQHLEKKLGLKPTMDNGFGGKEYEIDKRRIKPPRAVKKLSDASRKKLSERMHTIHPKRLKHSSTGVSSKRNGIKEVNYAPK